MKANFSVLLDNLRSAHNVGSILRTADGAGFTKVYLSGITPTPKTKGQKVTKVSLGAEDSVDWQHVWSTEKQIKKLQAEGVQIVALEYAKQAVSYREFEASEADICLVVGNEPDGIAEEILELCDAIIKIPMRGAKESLNVSNAFAVAAYELTREFS